MAAAPTVSPEQEAQALDRILTRLALTEEDALEGVIAKLLPKIIPKLHPPSSTTQPKVMAILTHINKRVKGHTAIKLPLQDLLALYSSTGDGLVRNFALVYVEMAFSRASVEEKAGALPLLLLGVQDRNHDQQALLLRLACDSIEARMSQYRPADEKTLREECAPFLGVSASRSMLLSAITSVLKFSIPKTGEDGRVTYIVSGAPRPAPGGLSPSGAKRVAGSRVFTANTLGSLKLACLNFLPAAGFTSDEMLLPALVACEDGNHTVSSRANELLRRVTHVANLEEASTVRDLFRLFLGSGSETIEENKVEPAGPSLKVRLMGLLTKSVKAANLFPGTLQVLFDCLYGEATTLRLKQAGMEFSVWVFKHAEDSQLEPLAPVMLQTLLRVVDAEEDSSDSSSLNFKVFTFSAIGQLAQRIPHLVNKDSTVAERYFKAMETNKILKSSMQEATISLAEAYKGVTGATASSLETLLLRTFKHDDESIRSVVVQWACRIFPFSSISSRYICILACGDTKFGIREEGKAGLKPPSSGNKRGNSGRDQSRNAPAYPDAKSVFSYILSQHPAFNVDAKLDERLIMPPLAFAALIQFVHVCVERREVSSSDLGSFWQVLQHALVREGNSDLHRTATSEMIVLLTWADEVGDVDLTKSMASRFTWIRSFLDHTDITTRENIAKLMGVASKDLSTQELVTLIRELNSICEKGLLDESNSSKVRFEAAHGSIVALGFIVAQNVRKPELREMVDESLRTLWRVLPNRKSASGGALRDPEVQAAAAMAIGRIAAVCPLPVETGEWPRDDVKPEEIDKLSRCNIVHRLSVVQLSANEAKVVQSAALALGLICGTDASLSIHALPPLLSLSGNKNEDVFFSVGEALCLVWGGAAAVLPMSPGLLLGSHFSSLYSTPELLPEKYYAVPDAYCKIAPECTAKIHSMILKSLFEQKLYDSRPLVRCAGCVWLFSLLRFMGRHTSLAAFLPECQEAFSQLLGDQNEITQEIASRGTSLVYELGDAETKKELVSALVGSLSGAAKKRKPIKLTDDTEIFVPGSLGQTPDGKGISTYKELCQVVTEMGKPDLLYRFMDLANHEAMISSSRGAAFGVVNIADKAGEELKAYLPSLIPRLFRLQYDPNKATQDAMMNIWKALIPEPKQAINDHFRAIMKDLLSNITGRLWKSREASCAALADLIQGRQWPQIEQYFKEIWEVTFRAMDDIKETVRVAATNLCRTLSGLTGRLCDPALTSSTDSASAVADILPILVHKGLNSTVKEVQTVSLQQLMKVAKVSGNALRPHIPDLVYALLEALSSLESQQLSYLQLHAERLQVDTEKLEKARVAVSSAGSMQDTLDLCLRQVDDDVMQDLVPRLVAVIKTGVGLNTRVGAAKFISQLALQNLAAIRPHSGSLIKALLATAPADKSNVVRKAYYGAAATVARFAPDARVLHMIESAIDMYKKDGDHPLCGATLLRELSRHASDALAKNLTVVLPLAFVAKHNEDKEIAAAMKEVWVDNTSSESSSLQLYAPEIVTCICDGLQSSVWGKKKESAKAISSLAKVLRSDLAKYAGILTDKLRGDLDGRIWEGKDKLLHALGDVGQECGAALVAQDSDIVVRMTQAALQAMDRKQLEFQLAAVGCLRKIFASVELSAEGGDDVAIPSQLVSEMAYLGVPKLISLYHCTTATVEVNADDDEAEVKRRQGRREALAAALVDCMKAALGMRCQLTDDQYEEIGRLVVHALHPSRGWALRLSGVHLAATFVLVPSQGAASGSSHDVLLAVDLCCDEGRYSQLREAAIDCYDKILRAIAAHKVTVHKTALTKIQSRLTSMADSDKNTSVRAAALRAQEHNCNDVMEE